MPHATLKLIPGVDQNRTLALNEAAISESNLIRFIPDKQNIGLVQKLGGWTKYYPDPIESVIRALWAWEDTNSQKHLSVGYTGLSVISDGAQTVITPKRTISDVAVSVSTQAGSSAVEIYDVNSAVNTFDTVDIRTQISVGGLILFGSYSTTYVSGSSYIITAVNAIGQPQTATTTVSNGGALPRFYTTDGSSFVDVLLYDHNYIVGDTFPILVETTVAGIVLYGNYTVVELDTLSSSGPFVGDGNSFRIIANSEATSGTNAYMNGGDAEYIYYRAPIPLPTGTGYGVGGYGTGGYGIGTAPVPISGDPITATDWTLDNWGEDLIACPVGGQIYYWSPTSGYTEATIINGAPTVNDGAFVAMPQRQIIAWGSTNTGIQDPLLLCWCDVNNFNQWIPLPINQAGSFRIPKGSRIVGCIQGPQQGLIWTDLAVWAMQYVGPPFVYQINEIGTGCGLISRKAAASMNGIVYWMSQSQFYRLGPNGVEIIRCPIWDVIFQDIDMTNVDKIRIAPNSRFGEISWFYPTTTSGGEVSNYAKYNVYLDQWDFGELSRTAWINQSVLGPPIGAGTTDDFYIYQHETSTNADDLPMLSSFQTGYFVLSDAEWKIFVDQIWPDMKWGYYNGAQSASVQITFYVADYPGVGVLPAAGGVRTYGPFTMTDATTFITPRFRGRLMSIKIESSDLDSFWRIGAMRYRYQQDGKF